MSASTVSDRLDLDALVASAADLVDVLRERSAEIDETGVIPRDITAALDDAGLYKIGIDRSLGGIAPIPTATGVEIMYQLGRGNGSVAWSVAADATGSSDFPAGWSPQLVEEMFNGQHVGPLTAGSALNLSHGIGIGKRVDDGMMVHGSWSFSSNIRRAAWLMAGVAVEEDGETTHCLAMIPRDQCRIADDWRVTGLRGTSSNSAFITEPIFVPDYRFKQLDLDSSDIVSDDSDMMAMVASVKTQITAAAAGMAAGALEVFIEKAKTRAPWSQPYERIADMPTIHTLVGRSRARLDVGLASLNEWARRLDARAAGTDDLEEMNRICMGAVLVMNDLKNIPEQLRDAMGSSTARASDSLGRYARDAITLALHADYRIAWLAEEAGRDVFDIKPSRPIVFSSSIGTPKLPSHVELIDDTAGVPW